MSRPNKSYIKKKKKDASGLPYSPLWDTIDSADPWSIRCRECGATATQLCHFKKSGRSRNGNRREYRPENKCHRSRRSDIRHIAAIHYEVELKQNLKTELIEELQQALEKSGEIRNHKQVGAWLEEHKTKASKSDKSSTSKN